METYMFWSFRAPGPPGRRVEDDDAGMEHVEIGTFASSFLRPAKLPKLDWNSCLCHSGPCVFTWASSWVAFSRTGDRGRLCRLHTGSVRDDCLHALLCDRGARLDAPCGFYDRVCYQKLYSRATSCHTRRISKRRRGGRPSSPVSSRQQSGEELWAQLQRTWRKLSPTVHAKQWLQSLTGCLCKTHSESSSQYWQQTLSFLPTRDKKSQRQSLKALELGDDPCIHVGHVLLCPSKGGWAGPTGGHFQPVLTWPDCQRNNYATIKYHRLFSLHPDPNDWKFRCQRE